MTAPLRSPLARPGHSGHPGRPGAAVLALLAALGAGACNVPGARIYNLRQLHEDSGRHVRDARLVSGLEYFIRHGTADLFGQRLSKPREGGDRSISDPLNACVRNVSGLARIESRDARVTAAQVSLLAWLAVDDPWKLSREVCVRALGAHGARLGAEVPGPRGAPVAGPDQVRAALTNLVAALRASGPLTAPELLPEGAEAPAPASSGGIDGACAAIEGLELDRAGALRLLRGIGALESGLARSDPRAARLAGTLRALEAACVAETLLLALKDEAPPEEAGGSHPGWGSPLVRAAAVTACVEAFGDPALGELLLQLDRERSDEVVRAVLAAVTERGLPQPGAQIFEEARPLLVQRWIDTILLHAYDNPSGTVRVAAMRALERISGGELSSLREEDWLRWAQARGETGADLEHSAGPGEPARP